MLGVILTMFLRGYLLVIAPKMQHIVFYASFSMSYVFLYLIGLAHSINWWHFYINARKLTVFYPALVFIFQPNLNFHEG